MYSKLFSTLIHSSLWREPIHVRILFVTLLSIADSEGFVYGSRPGLEAAANIRYDPEKGDVDPWTVLLSPDPNSSDLLRNPANEGRRIERVPGGYRILNFLYYHSLRDRDARREQNRRAKRKERQQNKVSNRQPRSATVSNRQQGRPSQQKSAHEYTDTDTDTDNSTRVLSSKERTKERCARALCAPNQKREEELMGLLREILPQKEMNELGGLWRRRIQHCAKAVAFAIEDYQVRTPQQRGNIRNIGAWLTDRHARALLEVLGAREEK
jgi:hypothetical protein